MTHITKVLAVPATGAYYYEDLSALQANPTPLGQRYTAGASTEGFDVVREVSEGVSVGLILDDATVAWGDCVAVAYSGKAGRAPVFRTARGLDTLQRVVAPTLRGRELTSFRELAAELETLTESITLTRPIPPQPQPQQEVDDPSRRQLLTSVARLLRPYPDDETTREEDDVPTKQVIVERQLHPAVRYGVSQALLKAMALKRGLTMAEVIAQEWDLPRPDAPVPIHAQSGGERYLNADKMIVRRVASLPHALVDNIPEQLGEDGVKLVQYTRWLKERIQELGLLRQAQDDVLRQAQDDYRPTIHLDVHGALGQIFENNLGKVLGQLYAMESAAAPYPLRVECPVMMESRQAQIEAMKALREYVRFRKMKVQLVADEWANTLDDIRAFIEAGAADMIQVKMPDLGGVHNSVEAVLACQAGGVGAFLGGSCAETDLSARVAVHVALATRPDIIMAKPGMGVDEGVTIVQNEMTRTLAWMRAQRDIGY
jgi:methylaspartate ammonia-lyase